MSNSTHSGSFQEIEEEATKTFDYLLATTEFDYSADIEDMITEIGMLFIPSKTSPARVESLLRELGRHGYSDLSTYQKVGFVRGMLMNSLFERFMASIESDMRAAGQINDYDTLIDVLGEDEHEQTLTYMRTGVDTSMPDSPRPTLSDVEGI